MNFIVDRSEFDKALKEYAAASKKDFAEVCNRQMLNLAIHGTRLVKVAQKGEIQRVQTLDWWPKYVAKLLSQKKFAQKVTRAYGRSEKSGTRAQARFMRGGNYTRDQARRFSAQLIRKRSRSIGFLRFFFVLLGRTVKPYTPGGRVTTGKAFSGFAPKIIPATPARPRCEISIVYEYRRRSRQTARKSERMLNAILRSAYPVVAADMRVYIENKMKRTAARYSAKGAK